MHLLHSFHSGTRVFFAVSLALAASSAASAQKAVLTPHVPRIVQEGLANRVSAQAVSAPMQLVLSLPLRNPDALTALLADLYNPASKNYRQWLTPDQFDAQFGPTADDYTTLVQWARANALDVVAKSSNKRILTVQASTALINRAFNITETTYHDSVRNRDFVAPDREPTTDLAIPLLAISGLDTSNPRVNHYSKKPVDAGAGTISDLAHRAGIGETPQPETTFTGSGASGYFLPSDMRAAYYGTGPLTGAGQSVDIFSYDGYLAADLPKWYSSTGVTPSTVPVTNVLTGGFDGGCELDSPCDDGEQILDILQVQGMTPGLSGIHFYEGLSAVTELNQMVTDNYAHVITSSWSGGDFGPACDPFFLQMAAQGTTYLNATGDSGGYNPFTYLPPGLDPYIVEVGGTDLVTTSGTQAWASETAWVDSGGGFFDPNIAIPSWQAAPGVITATNKGSALYRNSPDMAAEADYNNTTVINGTFEKGYGGTSYATPRMAGYIALANQQSVANGTGTVGFINPSLYEYGLRSTYSSIFHDITSGSAPATVTYNGVKVSYASGTGYDLVTGWGSPNGTGLLNALTGPNYSVALDASTYGFAIGSTATANLTVTPVNGFSATPVLTVTNLPTGVTATSVLSGNTFQVTLSNTAGSTQTSGIATFTVTSGAITHATTATINLTKRANFDFALSATAATAQQTLTGTSTITVTDGNGFAGVPTLSIANLPAGVTASFGAASANGTITLTFSPSISTAPGTYTLLLTGSIPTSSSGAGVTHTIPLTLTLTGAPSVLSDGDFESATSPWTFTSTLMGAYLCNTSCGFYQHGGTYFAYLNGFGATDTDVLSQSVTISGGTTSATLNFWLWIATQETTTTTANDKLTISVTNASGTVTTLATLSNLNKTSGYVLYTYDVTPSLGQTVTLKFSGTENSSKPTAFLIDDVSIVVK